MQGIASMAEAYLPTFIKIWNQKFAVDPRDASSAHRRWKNSAEDLDAVLARREERVLSKALTFRAGGSMYCVKTSGPGTALRGRSSESSHDGSMRVHYKDRVLTCTAYKRQRTRRRSTPGLTGWSRRRLGYPLQL